VDLQQFLASENFKGFLFGFGCYGLLLVWLRLAARWVNWFPLLAKLTRFCLYAVAVALLFLGLQVLSFEQEALLMAGVGAVCAPLINHLAKRLRPRERLRRGAVLSDVSKINKLAARQHPAADFKDAIKIGGVKIPRSVEPYHFFVVGATGTGKSVAITRVLDNIQERGDVALVVDSGGDFASRYFSPGRDHILNPFDDRCAAWSPTAEMQGPWDAEALAKSMIPDGVGDSKEWNAYAQTLVTSVLRKLSEKKRLSIKDLLYYIQAAPVSELEPFLAGTPAAAQLVSDKMFGSIRTIAANYLSTYAYLSDSDSPFSITKFIHKEQPGFLFITYRDDQLDSLRNMISCALDVAARTILSMPPNSQRRVWLIIDEFASIGRVQSIETLATKSRKVGGCLLVGLQSVSQLKDRYGEEGAQTILSCLSSWLVLRCSDTETAEYISRYIGEAEISRMTRGESSSLQGGSDSLNEQIQTERAVLPVQLQRLANLEGFFKLAGDYPIAQVKLAYPAKREKVAQTYSARDFDAKPMLVLMPEATELPAVQTSQSEPDLQFDQGEAIGGEEFSVDSGAEALEVPSALNITQTDLEKGPEELEEVLNTLAENHEASLGECLEAGLGH